MSPHADHNAQDEVASPAVLIARAVGLSHAQALGAVLDEKRLAWRTIEVQTEAAGPIEPARHSLDSVTLFPSIVGGEPYMHDKYAAAALEARDRSPVSHAIRGNVAYKVGVVTVVPSHGPDSPALGEVKSTEPGNSFATGPTKLMSRHLAAFNGHVGSHVTATLHSDCVFEDVALGRRVQGQTAINEYYRSWWDAFDVKLTGLQCYHGEAGMVTVEGHCAGMHVGTFRGIEPTRRQIDLRTVALLRIHNGLIAEVKVYYDVISLLHQLGAAIAYSNLQSSGVLQ
jgi:steroid delta-isomerase-like uncharacterized protein